MKRLFAIALVLGTAACSGGAKPKTEEPVGNADWEVTEEPMIDAAPLPEAPPLAVTAMDPRAGGVAGGDAITFGGASFLVDGKPRAVKVFFAGVEALDVAVLDDATLSVVTPPGTAGAVDVLIQFEPGGEITLPGAYTYQ
jgi:hypothetical protein